MSELLLTAENEGLNLTDCLLPTATLGSWSVWGEEEASPANRLVSIFSVRDHPRCGFEVFWLCYRKALSAIVAKKSALIGGPCKQIVFLTGPKPPPPPLPSASSSPTTLSEKIPRLVHPHHVLVVDQDGVVLSDRPRIIPPTSVLSSSTLSPFSKNATDGHQPSSPYLYDHDQDYATMYKSPSSYSPEFATKPFSPSDHYTELSSGISDIYDLDFDYSHLICSHNIDDFGDDIAYGQPGTCSLSSTPREPCQSRTEPDFSFIDSIYESVKAEIESEQASAVLFTLSYSLKVGTSRPSPSPEAPGTPVITLDVNNPVTIVVGDGKEYKVVLQEVKPETKSATKRKSSSPALCPKPKRSPGVSLAELTIEEINARKREQNREEERLEKRNAFLRVEASRLQEQIDELRKAILSKVGK
ncbi:unnamed protein product [Heligmosomoides polygyrus]|uniref:BZIP domain-containing protein n=1 Tax=Heligmosomoides polygyrus TaxID=6339 RepID=A0A183FM91_HELPZ|nr:unnamed protein product [Heligmosomoides polygyrus]